MMNETFERWFAENSGYALHQTPKRRFSSEGCCGEEPLDTGKKVLFPHPESGRMEPFSLYRCRHCGKHYVRWKKAFCRIQNLLKVQILP